MGESRACRSGRSGRSSARGALHVFSLPSRPTTGRWDRCCRMRGVPVGRVLAAAGTLLAIEVLSPSDPRRAIPNVKKVLRGVPVPRFELGSPYIRRFPPLPLRQLNSPPERTSYIPPPPKQTNVVFLLTSVERWKANRALIGVLSQAFTFPLNAREPVPLMQQRDCGRWHHTRA